MGIVIIVIFSTLVLIRVVWYFIMGRLKKDVWEGELTKKQEEVSNSGDYDTTNYVLYVKTNEGLQKRVYVKKKLYDELTAGDKLIKVAGEAFPKKTI